MRVGFVRNVALRRAVALRRTSVARGLREAAALVCVLVADGLVRAMHELLGLATRATTTRVVGLAAADGEEPEEAGTDSERGRDPDCGQKLLVEAAADAIEPGRALNDTDHNNRCGRSESRGGTDSRGGDTGDDESDAREGAATISEDAEEDLDSERDVGDDEDNLRPPRSSAERHDAISNLLGNRDVLSGERDQGVDIAHREVQRRLSPVEGGLRALSRSVLGRVAITPEVNIVEVIETEVGSRDVVARAAGRARGEKIHIVEILRVGLGASRIEDAVD